MWGLALAFVPAGMRSWALCCRSPWLLSCRTRSTRSSAVCCRSGGGAGPGGLGAGVVWPWFVSAGVVVLGSDRRGCGSRVGRLVVGVCGGRKSRPEWRPPLPTTIQGGSSWRLGACGWGTCSFVLCRKIVEMVSVSTCGDGDRRSVGALSSLRCIHCPWSCVIAVKWPLPEEAPLWIMTAEVWYW